MTTRVLGAAALTTAFWLASAPGAGAQAPPTESPPRPPMIHAKAMTLREMTRSADKIFQGKVTKVATEEAELKGSQGKSVKLKVNVITFEVTDKIKGDVEVGKPLVVRQVASAGDPPREGEEVLWYLATPGKSGFTAPLGVYSGHFKVRPDPQQPQSKVVVNLLDNKGLWSATGSLIEADGKLDRATFAGALDKKAELPEGRAERIMNLASQPNRPGPLPLDLITTASERLLTDQP